METQETPRPWSWLRSPSGLVLLAFVGIAGMFLVAEHAAHLLGALPYLLLLLCPLLHLFHGGHGRGHDDHDGSGHGAQGR